MREWSFQPYRFLGNDVPCVAEVVVPFGQVQPSAKADEAQSRARAEVATKEGLPKFGEYVYVEVLPKAIEKVSPVQPENVTASGTVLVQALVGADGLVKDTKITKSIPELDDTAIAAARQWVFKPARKADTPVAVWVAIPIRFPPK